MKHFLFFSLFLIASAVGYAQTAEMETRNDGVRATNVEKRDTLIDLYNYVTTNLDQMSQQSVLASKHLKEAMTYQLVGGACVGLGGYMLGVAAANASNEDTGSSSMLVSWGLITSVAGIALEVVGIAKYYQGANDLKFTPTGMTYSFQPR